DAQQIYSIAGANFVITKATDLSGIRINDAGFEAARQEALDSPHQILRDTEKGLRYTAKTKDGGREVREAATSSLFIMGGALYNRALDYPVPLAGVNYFDSNLWGRGLQTNLFFAGVLLDASLSDPSLFGTKMDGSANLTGLGIFLTDRSY